MAAEEGSKPSPNRMMVVYSEATATTVGITACTPIIIAMRKLCLNKTGWVIWYPLRLEPRSLHPSLPAPSAGDLTDHVPCIVDQVQRFSPAPGRQKLNRLGLGPG